MYGEELIKVTMTFGVTESDMESNYEDLITAADHKLYSGKRNGRNQIVS
jgi:PleD family two-component response regulator